MTRILATNGSYRDDGIIDQMVVAQARALEVAGAEVEIVLLCDYPGEFCSNCRASTQQPCEAPGRCVPQDGIRGLIDRIEQADGYILDSPTNFDSVTAIFKRFMERLAVYAIWALGMIGLQYRKARSSKKKAMLVSSCAAPGIIGHWLFGTDRQLKMRARTIGAECVVTLFTGMIARRQHPVLPEGVRSRLAGLGGRMV